MKQINWKVRFNKQNASFVIRALLSIFIPVFSYLGSELEQITSWPILGHLLVQAISNPYLVGLMVVSFLNMVPDNTTAGLADSSRALGYKAPPLTRRKGK